MKWFSRASERLRNIRKNIICVKIYATDIDMKNQDVFDVFDDVDEYAIWLLNKSLNHMPILKGKVWRVININREYVQYLHSNKIGEKVNLIAYIEVED